MRIAIVTEHVNRRGGQERVVAEVAERLSRYHEVHLFCFEADPLKGERLTVHPVWCPFRSSSLQGLWILATSPFFLRDPHFDAVISQGGNSLRQNFCVMHTCHALRAARTRDVEWRYHPPSFPKRLTQRLRARLFLHFEGRAVKRCKGRVMTVSRFLKDYAMAQHGLSEEDIHVTENGVDHATFHPGLREHWRPRVREQLGIPEEAFVVLFVGGRWFDKGVPFLVEALRLMKDRQAHLVVVGKGDVEFFQEFAARQGVADRLHLCPPTDEPQRYYASADCFGFPSDAEGFPLVIGEAASCGLPLITTPVGGAEHLVEEGVSGFIVPPDAAQIADRLDRLAGDRERLAAMSDAVYRKSLKLSWDAQARAVMRVLEQGTGLGLGTSDLMAAAEERLQGGDAR
jgi:glycosyltransferase involved in cell wall biosynthesis